MEIILMLSVYIMDYYINNRISVGVERWYMARLPKPIGEDLLRSSFKSFFLYFFCLCFQKFYVITECFYFIFKNGS